MFCAQCRKQNREGANFCDQCGSPIRSTGSQDAPDAPERIDAPSRRASSFHSGYAKPAIAAVLLLVLVYALLLIIYDSESPNTPETSGAASVVADASTPTTSPIPDIVINSLQCGETLEDFGNAGAVDFTISLNATNSGEKPLNMVYFGFNILTPDRKIILGDANALSPEDIKPGQSFDVTSEAIIDYNPVGGLRTTVQKMTRLLHAKLPPVIDVITRKDEDLRVGGQLRSTCHFVKVSD